MQRRLICQLTPSSFIRYSTTPKSESGTTRSSTTEPKPALFSRCVRSRGCVPPGELNTSRLRSARLPGHLDAAVRLSERAMLCCVGRKLMKCEPKRLRSRRPEHQLGPEMWIRGRRQQ